MFPAVLQRLAPIASAVCFLGLTSHSVCAAAELTCTNAQRAAAYSEARRGVSLLVIQNGKTVYEHYARGVSAETKWPIFSGTKSFWGVAAMIAVQEHLWSLEEPVAATIGEWRSDPQKSRIILRELLNFTDGLEPASRLHRASITDRNAVAIRLPQVAPPGTAFTYGPSHLQVLCEVLRRKTGGRPPFEFLNKRVLAPLGLPDLEHKEDARGNPLLASGFKLTAREWARFGALILGRGEYRGRRIVAAEMLEPCFRGSAINPAYGLTFWLNREAANPGARETDIENLLERDWSRADWRGVCICRAAPADMVVALGSGYQRCFIIPSMNAVIVRQGSNAAFSDAKFLRLVLGRAG